MLTIKERVENGVKILDNYDPDWANKIDLEILNLGSFEGCILGQLFDDKKIDNPYRIAELFASDTSYFESQTWNEKEIMNILCESIKCGFDTYINEDVLKLNAEWKCAILKRLQNSKEELEELNEVTVSADQVVERELV